MPQYLSASIVYRVLYEQTVTRVYLSSAPQLCTGYSMNKKSRVCTSVQCLQLCAGYSTNKKLRINEWCYGMEWNGRPWARAATESLSARMASSRQQAEQLKKNGDGDDDEEERTTTDRWVPASDYWRRHNLQRQRQQQRQQQQRQHPNEGWYLSRLDGILEDLTEGTGGAGAGAGGGGGERGKLSKYGDNDKDAAAAAAAAAAASAPAAVLKLFREMYSVGRVV